jgi:hypothetical protein
MQVAASVAFAPQHLVEAVLQQVATLPRRGVYFPKVNDAEMQLSTQLVDLHPELFSTFESVMLDRACDGGLSTAVVWCDRHSHTHAS